MTTPRMLVPDVYKNSAEFERTLTQAFTNAQPGFEMKFCEDINDRYLKFGGKMYFSDKQEELLDRIAWGNA